MEFSLRLTKKRLHSLFVNILVQLVYSEEVKNLKINLPIRFMSITIIVVIITITDMNIDTKQKTILINVNQD